MELHQSYFRPNVVTGLLALLVSYTAVADEPKQPPTQLGPEEHAHVLSKEGMSPDALVSMLGIYGLHKQEGNLAWTAAVQIALTHALGPATAEDPAYLQALPSRNDPVVRIFAARAFAFLMRPEVQVTLFKGEKVQAAIEAGHVDSIVDDDLRRALVRRLARIISSKDPQYTNDEARGWAVKLLGYLRNSKTDQDVEEDILYDIIMAGYLEEASYYVRNQMLELFKDPTYLENTPGPEQFLCERVTDTVITSLERAKALQFLAERPPHGANKELRLQTLIAASQSKEAQLRSLAVFELSEFDNVPDAREALITRLLEDESVYIRFLSAQGIRLQEGGHEVLRSVLPALKESLSRDEAGALFSPTFLSTIERWTNEPEAENAQSEDEGSEAEADGDEQTPSNAQAQLSAQEG